LRFEPESDPVAATAAFAGGRRWPADARQHHPPTRPRRCALSAV